MSLRKHIIVLAATVATVLLAPGCAGVGETIERATAWRDRAADARASVADELAGLERARADLPATDPTLPTLDAAIAGARTRLNALDAAVRHADLVLEEMREPADTLTRGVTALSPLLPPGAQGPALLGAALVATALRARQVRQGAESIVASIQAAMKDPDFQTAFQRQATTIRSVQTPVARRLVDSATGDRALLRSPI